MEKNTSVKDFILNKFKERKPDRILIWCAVVFAVCLAIDLVTKGLAELFIQEGELIPFIPGFMNFTLSYNSGMAFSMFSDNPIAMGIITWLTVPVMLFFCGVVYFLPKHYNICRVLLSAVTAGALGNFIDRVFIAAGVRDFMDVSSIGFGVCNFADYFISIGGVILVVCYVYCVLTDPEIENEKKEGENGVGASDVSQKTEESTADLKDEQK